MAGRTDLEQLTYTISADIAGLKRTLDKAVSQTGDASGRIQRKLNEVANDNWSKKLGRAFDDTFGAARQRTFDAGASRLGVLGSGLNGLGAAGIVAAAGVAAVAVAYGQARKAMDIADEISDSAAQLGIGTKSLQEYRYAARLAGADIHDADTAIAGFTKTLGLARLGNAKALKVFDSLKIDPRQFKTAEEALDAVTAKLAALDSESDRQALASKLGLEPLIPLLRKGTTGIADLKDEAHRYGLVISDDIIAKAGDAKDKLETMSQVIDTQLSVAFADLAPLIADAAGALADFLSNAVKVINKTKEFARSEAGQTLVNSTLRVLTGGVLGNGPVKPVSQGRTITRAELDAAGFAVPKPAGFVPGSLGKGGGGGGRHKAKGDGIYTGPDANGFISADNLFQRTVDLDSVRTLAEDFKGTIKEAFTEGGDFTEAGAGYFKEFSDRIEAEHDRLREGTKDAISGGLEAGFRDGLPGVLAYLAQALQRTLIDAASAGLADALTSRNPGTGGKGNLITSAVMAIFGGGRASSGPVQKGKFYRVNENTPNSEYFAPGVSGSIVSPEALRSAVGVGSRAMGAQPRLIMPLHIHAEGAVLANEFLQQAKAYANGVGQVTYGRAVADSLKGSPAALSRFNVLGSV